MTAMAVLLGDPVHRPDRRSPSSTASARPTPGGASVVALVAQAGVRRRVDPVRDRSRRAPRSSCSWPRTRASTPSRAWPRSSPRTATCRASSPSAATGSPTRGGSSCWRPSPSACSWAFGGDTHALIPLYSVGVFVCFTLSQIGMVRHWLHGARARAGGGGWRQRARGRPDRGRPRRRRLARSSSTAPTSS